MLALVPHPARVAEAGGVDTAAGEAGAGPLARLGLGHLRVERQVEEAIAKEPVVPVQQPEGGAPTAAGRPSPTEPRGGRLRGASEGRAPRLHLAQRPCPAGLCLRARTGMRLRGNPAGENRAPAAAAAAASAPLHRRPPQSRSRVRRDRSQPRPPPLGSVQSHAGIASRAPDLVLSGPSPQPRRPGPGWRRGSGGAGCAGRSGGDLREGTCGRRRGPRARPRLARGSRQLPRRPAPRAREGGGQLEPRGGRAQRGRGSSGSRGQPRTARPAAGGPPAAIFPPVPLASHRGCGWSPRGVGLPPRLAPAHDPPPQAQRRGLAPPGLEPGTLPRAPTRPGPGAEG